MGAWVWLATFNEKEYKSPFEGFRVNQAYFGEWGFRLARDGGITVTPGAQG